MLVNDGVRVGTRRGSTELLEVGGHCLGVAPNIEQTLLVIGEEANPAVNIMAFLHHMM